MICNDLEKEKWIIVIDASIESYLKNKMHYKKTNIYICEKCVGIFVRTLI